MGRHLTRWLIPLPAIILSFWPTLVRADPVPGLNAVGYSVTAIPPTKSDTAYTICHSETENNINRNFNGEPFGNCPVDMFMVHYTGFITIPANNTIKFMVAADDGGTVKIGLTEFGTWNDKSCQWSAITSDLFPAGSYALDGWFYENGGSTCYMLAWDINNTGWAIVPDSAFTTNAVPATTTTTSTTTTSTSTTTSTTTTEPATTTSTTTTLPATTTTTVPETTTTQTTTTTTTTTTTVAPTTTTTEAPYTPPQTTTSSSSTSLPEQPTTTTTSLPEPSTTVEETTSTTVPLVTVPTVLESVPTLPAETSTTTSQPLPQTSIPETVPEEVESSSTTTIPDIDPEVFTEEELDAFVEELDIVEDEPISDEKVEKILEVLADAAPEQIVAAIEQVLATNITSDQAVSIASSPEVLEAVTEEQAEAIFEEIVVEELTLEVAEELVAVLNEAPTKVKKAFQETINVFAGVFDSFQMVGQTIPVGERRTLLAVSNTLVAVGASLRRRDR